MADTVSWIDPDGVTTALAVDWDTNGRWMPPIILEQQGIPLQPGALLRSVRHGPRDIAFPLWISGTSDSDLLTKLRALVLSMDPTRGDGRIQVANSLGTREIKVRYVSGLEMSERLGDTSGPTVQRAVAMFRAFEPYWTDTSDTSVSYMTGSSPGSFFPFFPLNLASSEIFASDSVTNLGDVEAWPVWTITGPGSSIILRNLTTGKLLDLETTLAAGDTVTIDTRPGHKTVTKSDGTNLYASLTATSSLWSLARGVNSIRVEMATSTSASSVVLARRHRYLGV